MEKIPEGTKFLHYRYSGANGLLATGGITIAYRAVGDGKIVHAASRCHPRDNFVKHTGRIRAAGRTLSKHAQVFNGTEDAFLTAIEQACEVQSSMYQAAYGVTLARKYSGKRKSQPASVAGLIGN